MSKRAKEAALKAYPKRKDGRLKYYPCTDDDVRKIYAQGYRKAEKDLAPLINRLCEAILFEWKDAADLARKTLTQIKAREE
jgi:hypothetical protein